MAKVDPNRKTPGLSVAQSWLIAVVQNEKTGSFQIRQNLHYRFGKTGGNVREYRQAHIPILLHDRPEEVLLLDLGTGLTAGGAIPHDSPFPNPLPATT